MPVVIRDLGAILLQVLAPIILLAGAGFILRRRVDVSPRAISRVVYFVLTPCLIYTSLLTFSFDPEITSRSLLFAAIQMIIVGGLAYFLTRRWGYSGGLASAFIITTILLNNGNYGLPLNLFAFGETGLAYALLLFMFNAVFAGAVSIYLAISGQDNGMAAIRRTLKQPIIWAIVLAGVSRATHLIPTGSLMKMLQMTGQAAIPVFLIVLGMSLAQTDVRANLAPVLRLTTLRMIISPLIALAVASVVGLSGVAYSVAVMQASMPTAVNSIVITNEFETAPDFTAGVVLMTTLVSLVTLPVLLFFLR